MATDSNELLGQALGTCTLQRLIGHGGMGVVYLAQQSRPRRTVAVKVLMPDNALGKKTRAEFLTRFRREADAIAALDHIHIMPIYEYGEQEEIAYLVMPYVAGGTLRDILEQRGQMPLKEAVSILEQAASALDCAHAQGIVHRDLKPGNMLFHSDGRVLLADFGLAKVLKESREGGNGKYSALTSTGTIIGTPEYLSPEQSMGKTLDHRSDIYSLGIVLFQMLTGRVPFTGVSPVAVAIKHSLEEPPSLCQLNPSIPPAVEAVVMTAMKKDPARRYKSAGEFARALHQAIYEPLPNATSPYRLEWQDADEQSRAHIHDVRTLTTVPHPPPASLIPAVPPLPVSHGEQHTVPSAPPTLVTLSASASPRYDAEKVGIERLPTRLMERNAYAALRARRRPTPRHVIASIAIVLLLVAGGWLSYHNIQQGTTQKDNHAKTVVASHSPTPTTRKLSGPPMPPLIAVGSLLYSTSLPGPSCDPNSGAWSSTTNARVTCGNDTTQLRNTDSGHLAGIFLDRLPRGQSLPGDYIIQVQVDADPAAPGEFGVFFRNQPGSQQGTYSFLLSSSGFWKASIYDNQTGSASLLYGQQVTQVQLGAVNTIDIIVQGDTFTFYVNGYRQGDAISDQYSQGTIGLAAGDGTPISFKNLSLYRLPGS